jgi:hypothetical protein
MFVLWERAMPAILQRPFARMARSYGTIVGAGHARDPALTIRAHGALLR